METTFVIIGEERRSDMHGVHKGKSLLDTTCLQTLLNLGRNVDERPAFLDIEPEFFSVALYLLLLRIDTQLAVAADATFTSSFWPLPPVAQI